MQRRLTLIPSTDWSVCGDRRSLYCRELQAPVPRLWRQDECPLGTALRRNGERVLAAAHHYPSSGRLLCSALGRHYQRLLVFELANRSDMRSIIDTRSRVVPSLYAGH